MVNLRQFCDQLSKDLKMGDDPIKEEAPGIYSFLIDEDGMAIKIEALFEGISVNCILCDCPKDQAESFLTEIMNGNLYGHITRNNVLGLTDDGNRLTLCRAIDYNIDYKGFSEIIQDFYNTALFWKEQANKNIIKSK